MAKKNPSKQPVSSAVMKKTVLGCVFGAVLVLLGFFINAGVIRYDFSNGNFISRTNRPSLNQFWSVYDTLQTKYDGTIEPAKLIEGAIRGQVAALGDPYTEYLDKEQSKALQDELGGNLSGIGIEIGMKNNKLTVIAPIEDTPASRAGLRSGDVIAAIDDKPSSGYSLDEAVAKIRGQKGTEVKLLLERGSTTTEQKITRDQITVASVRAEQKANNIGYLKIRLFGDDTKELVKKSVEEFRAAGVKGVVLDLRDNPGGYLETAVDVVGQFQDKGVVVVEKGKQESTDKTYYARGNATLGNIPIVILINGGSASASEITAGALRDNGRAVLVGEKTFGKGVVQEVLDLSSGSQLKVTIAKWFTPKGTNISREGIKPDIEVVNPATDFATNRDNQLERAIQELIQKMQ